MLTPIEQQPNLVLDPVRQQMIPAVPVMSVPTIPAADVPVQSTDTPSQNYQSKKGQGGDVAYEQKEQARVAAQLRAAWAYLQQLRAQMAQALSGGNAMFTKRIALDAADAAASIVSITMQMPLQQGSSQGGTGAPSTPVWIPLSVVDPNGNSEAASSSTTTTDNTGNDYQSLIDLARSGLGTAKDVVDQAVSIPHYSVEDRSLVNASARKVMEAMATVESLAARLSATPSDAGSVGSHYDVKA